MGTPIDDDDARPAREHSAGRLIPGQGTLRSEVLAPAPARDGGCIYRGGGSTQQTPSLDPSEDRHA
jgi:hypothetical protein